MNRKRGTQPGNTNALKHGFYSSRLKPGSPSLPQDVETDLNQEVNVLRLIIHRLSNMIAETDSHEDALKGSALIARAASRIGTLVRTQHLLPGEDAKNGGISPGYDSLTLDRIEKDVEAEIESEQFQQDLVDNDYEYEKPFEYMWDRLFKKGITRFTAPGDTPSISGEHAYTDPAAFQQNPYSRHFNLKEITALQQYGTDLSGEIDILHLTVHRVFDLVSHEVSCDELIKAYTIITDLITSVGTLIRTRSLLGLVVDIRQRAISQATQLMGLEIRMIGKMEAGK
jgi:hypothetical protein